MADLLLLGLALYLFAGVLFSTAFVLRGVERIDPASRGSPLSFRLLIFPGSVALWPLLACRWRRARQIGGRS